MTNTGKETVENMKYVIHGLNKLQFDRLLKQNPHLFKKKVKWRDRQNMNGTKAACQ